MPDEPTPETIDFIWSQAETRLEAQLRQADALDTKAGVLIGVVALGSGLAGSLAPGLEGPARWVAFGAILGLLIAGAFAGWAFRLQDYDHRPTPEALWRYAAWDEDQIKQRVLSTRFEALRDNGRKLSVKARLATASLISLGLVALEVSIAVLVVFSR